MNPLSSGKIGVTKIWFLSKNNGGNKALLRLVKKKNQ